MSDMRTLKDLAEIQLIHERYEHDYAAYVAMLQTRTRLRR